MFWFVIFFDFLPVRQSDRRWVGKINRVESGDDHQLLECCIDNAATCTTVPHTTVNFNRNSCQTIDPPLGLRVLREEINFLFDIT